MLPRLSSKYGTNFAEMRWSLGRYSWLADHAHCDFILIIIIINTIIIIIIIFFYSYYAPINRIEQFFWRGYPNMAHKFRYLPRYVNNMARKCSPAKPSQ
jgi:hypothetical protein